MKSLLIILLLALGLVTVSGAYGEQADTDQPTKIKANRMVYDDVKQINTFIGNVRLTRGTLVMKGDKMVLRQDPSGYQYGILYAPEGGLASFRQKRDGGGDLWVEGYAERMEYDSKTEVSKFFTRAKLKRLEGTKITDEVNGNFISYDCKTEIYTVSNKLKGDSKPGAERIKIILPPKEDKKSRPISNTVNQASSGDTSKGK